MHFRQPAYMIVIYSCSKIRLADKDFIALQHLLSALYEIALFARNISLQNSDCLWKTGVFYTPTGSRPRNYEVTPLPYVRTPVSRWPTPMRDRLNQSPQSAADQCRVWVLTDGKIGDDVQCIAIAKRLSPNFEKRVITTRPSWRWLGEWTAPWGPIDPRDAPRNANSPLAPPFPDVVIASGRRAIPYARAVKRATGGKCFVVIMKDPRIAPRLADMIWAPTHDNLDGGNIVTTLTSPHDISDALNKARAAPAPEIARLQKPMLGVILGGPSGGAKYDEGAADALIVLITEARKNFGSVAVTPSRRTPQDFLQKISAAFPERHAFVWDRTGHNPYVDILANSKALIVAADSHNMMSEAVATGTGVYAWRPEGLAKKLEWFVSELEDLGAVRACGGPIEPFLAAKIDSTGSISDEIRLNMGR